MTYSIVARDPVTGELGVAVASRFLATGAGAPFVRAGIGAIATQSFENQQSALDGLALLEAGVTAEEAIARLIDVDPDRSERQLGIVDQHGHSATYTGPRSFAWAGGTAGEGFAAQGNILAGPGVVSAMAERFARGGSHFGQRLVDSLEAGEVAGGDRRGRQSAALLVARVGCRPGYLDERCIDLRVDDNPAPVQELQRLLGLYRLSREPTAKSELLPIGPSLAIELSNLLEVLGAVKDGRRTELLRRMPLDPRPVKRLDAGIGRAGGKLNWDAFWHDALTDWMSIENLEARIVPLGWIDPEVLDLIRTRAQAVYRAV